MSRQEFRRTGSDAVLALQMIGGKAAESNAQLSGVVSTATQLGQAFMFGNGVGVAITAIAVGVGAVMNALDTGTPQTKEFKKTIDDLAKTDEAAKGLAQVSGATVEQSKTAMDAIKVNKDYAQSFVDIQNMAN